MPHNAVKAGIHNFLPFLDLHRAGKIGIFPHDLSVQAVGNQQNRGRRIDRPAWQMGPAKPEIQSGHHKSAHKHQKGKPNDRFLFRFTFLACQPFLQQLRGFQKENDAQNQHGKKQQPAEPPAVWVVQRSRRDKQEQTDHQEACGKFRQGLKKKFCFHKRASVQILFIIPLPTGNFHAIITKIEGLELKRCARFLADDLGCNSRKRPMAAGFAVPF